MVERGDIPKELSSAYAESNQLLENAYKEGQIKPLKVASRDIDEQVIRHMPLSMALELKALFKAELNIDFEAVDKARIKVIKKILKKGKIFSVPEYELLSGRVEEIYADPNRADEVESLNKILVKFEK